MAQDFRSARFWAAELIEPALYPGAVAIDATMGNGQDTLWLCEHVGEAGRVYAFDVQPEAVARTHARLADAGMEKRATLSNSSKKQRTRRIPSRRARMSWSWAAATRPWRMRST